MIRNFSLVAIALVASACGSFAPNTGKWTLTNFTVTANTCPEDDEPGDDEDVDVWLFLNEETETYTLGFESNAAVEDRMSCTLDKKDMACTDQFVVDLSEFDMDYVLTVNIAIDIAFSAVDAHTGTLVVSSTCAGEDCDAEDTCATTSTFDGSSAS
jgi:hypothetical protein